MTKKKKQAPEKQFVFTKENYKLMAIGVVIIVIGFLLMTGGKAASPDQFNPDVFSFKRTTIGARVILLKLNSPDQFNPDVFSFRRITLAPIVVLFGFAFEIYAIMKKPKAEAEKEE